MTSSGYNIGQDTWTQGTGSIDDAGAEVDSDDDEFQVYMGELMGARMLPLDDEFQV